MNFIDEYIWILDRPLDTPKPAKKQTVWDWVVYAGVFSLIANAAEFAWSFTPYSRWWALGAAILGSFAYSIYADWKVWTHPTKLWVSNIVLSNGQPVYTNWLLRDAYWDVFTKTGGAALAIFI